MITAQAAKATATRISVCGNFSFKRAHPFCTWRLKVCSNTEGVPRRLQNLSIFIIAHFFAVCYRNVIRGKKINGEGKSGAQKRKHGSEGAHIYIKENRKTQFKDGGGTVKKVICVCLAVILCAAVCLVLVGASKEEDYIKYVEFNVCYDALERAMNADIASQQQEIKINWIDVLAYLGAKYGGDFKRYKAADLNDVVQKLQSGEKIEDITKDMSYYAYYREAYGAVLDGFLGTYREKAEKDGEWEEKYGLKVYSPIAKTFPFSHFDDFGASRSYGYKRRHLGHDLMAATGTPVIAVESGVVEIMGWNQYGGWRIGIRSFDSKRYYYYAHLRQNRPFHPDLCEGKTVNAGDVIGYVGRTGYSATENTNGIQTSHLHYGMQLIFDESQKEGPNEIWIDMYAITKLLQKHQSAVYRVAATKEFYRDGDFSLEGAQQSQHEKETTVTGL